MGLLHQVREVQGKGVSCSSESPDRPAPGPPKGMKEESRGLRGERSSVPHPNTSVLRDREIPDEVGRGPGVRAGRKQGRRRDSNPGPAVLGVPPPAPFAFSCSFSHRLKGEKQNLNAAMSRVQ